MSRFAKLFQHVAKEKRPAYIPFLMLGDPNLTLSFAIIEAVITGGADALELGIPFSDPVADGPTVRQAANRALASGVNTDDCFMLIQKIRTHYPDIPIGLLVYANLVFHDGVDTFYKKASNVGVDAVLIPDVPTAESFPFTLAAKANGIHPIFLATPTCQQQDLIALAAQSEGYTYVVTRAGVTGTERQSEFDKAQEMVQRLNAVNAPPAVFGFGIKNAKEVSRAYEKGASGVIIGSALIQAISHMPHEMIENKKEISAMTKQLFYG